MIKENLSTHYLTYETFNVMLMEKKKEFFRATRLGLMGPAETKEGYIPIG